MEFWLLLNEVTTGNERPRRTRSANLREVLRTARRLERAARGRERIIPRPLPGRVSSARRKA